MMCGGASEVQAPSQELQSIVDSVREQCEEKAGRKFDEFTAVQYRSQTVAGTNYFVKVKVGGDEHIHVRIFVPLPHTQQPPQLANMESSKKADDPLEYF